MTVEENTLNNNIRLCECGCKQPTKLYRKKYNKFIHGHSTRGKYIGEYLCRGYKLILKPDHSNCGSNGYILEHRLVMERYLDRYLTKDEVVHHINHIKDDNRIENLQLIQNQNQHCSNHMIGNKYKLNDFIDMSNRFCFKCNSTETWINKKNKNRPIWRYHKNNLVCNKCYCKYFKNNKL